MLATTSTWCPSLVTAGSSACVSSSARRAASRCLAPPDPGDVVLGDVHPQRALGAVEDHQGAVGDVQRPRLDARDRRDVQRPGEDRDMRRRAAGLGAEAHHLRPVQRGGVRRREVLGDEDGPLGDVRLLPTLPGHLLQDALADVAHVRRALGEQLVLQPGEPVRVGGVGPPPGERRALALVDRARGDVEQVRVAQDLPVRGEDHRLVRVGVLPEPVLQGLELDHGPVEGLVEQAAFLVPVGGVLLDLDVLVVHPQDPPDAEAGRGRHSQQQVRILGAPGRSRRGRGRSGNHGGPRGLRDGDDAFLPQALPESVGDLLDRLRGVRTARDDLDLVALVDLHTHDGHHALRVRLVVPPFEPDVALVLLREVRQHGRRTRVQAGRVRDDDRVGGHGATGRHRDAVDRAVPLAAAERGLRDVVDPRGDQARPRRERREEVRVGDHHLGEQALRAGGDLVEVEADELVAGADPVADLHLRREALAAHLHGVQADVDQHLEIAEGTDGHGVPGRVKVDDLAVARGEKVVAQGVDRDTLADHLLREDRVGHLLDRHEDARQRGLQVKTRDGRCGNVRRHGCSPSGTPPARPAVNECRADPVLS